MFSKIAYRGLHYFSLGIIAIIISFIFIGTGHGANGKKSKPKPEINISELENQIHTLINKERQKERLSPLSWNAELNIIARKHSGDMADRLYFSHYSPEGYDFLYRYEQDGFRCEVKVGNNIHLGAENIFLANLFNSVTYINGIAYYTWNTMEDIANTVVLGWMKSPGHRKNILTPHWAIEGIGIVISDDGRVFVTQNFC